MAKCNRGLCDRATKSIPGWTLGGAEGRRGDRVQSPQDLATELARPLVAIYGSAAPRKAEDLQKWAGGWIDFPREGGGPTLCRTMGFGKEVMLKKHDIGTH